MYFNSGYLLVVLISMVLGGITQAYIKSTYNKWSRVRSGLGSTGADVARRMLNEGGAANVGITRVAGTLTDHFDPRDMSLHLSNDNYQGGSVASVAVACHEAGHAIQTAQDYAPGQFRTALVPIVSISQQAWPLVFFAGAFMGLVGMMRLAVILFAATVLFQLVTLPVEIDASRRAISYLSGTMTGEELAGAKQVLIAAALTYVAAALVSIINLLYLMSRVRRR
ncbi:MAG: zinc metallopeptidase [Atopobiaceae bacterium]|nr:zinc metallopeptidase [Atopobiaceae bacterium]